MEITRSLPVAVDAVATIENLATRTGVTVLELEGAKKPIREQGKRVNVWRISFEGSADASQRFIQILDDWSEAQGIF